MNGTRMGARERGDLISGGERGVIRIPDQKPDTSHYLSYCLSNSFLLEDIDVEIGSMWIHLTLFDQKLLKNWN